MRKMGFVILLLSLGAYASAYNVTTAPLPMYAGTSTGDGTFNTGDSVTVVAAPAAPWVFVNWTENGIPMSTAASYTFDCYGDCNLVANFVLRQPGTFFDFDNAPVHTGLPLDVLSGGYTAHLSATGQGFSIQPANSLGFTPVGFSGLCVYPNSVYGADLIVDFPRATLTAFSILYSPEEYACDSSATMRVTAYMSSTFVGTATATAVAGTWPTAILGIGTAQGFNRVVVHYDSPPPTGGDWGPVFLADNMAITGTLAPVGCRGDTNCDGLVTFADVDWFVEALAGESAWTHGPCPWQNADCSGDGTVTFADVDPFVTLLGTACP
jgi:hypothetical protein